MRIARVLLAAPLGPDPGGRHVALERVALERDDALYDVARFEACASIEGSPTKVEDAAADFRTRVVSLAGAGLGDVDRRLCRGLRPAACRLAPATFTWLPPCDAERALLVVVHGDALQIGVARALRGHREAVSVGDTGVLELGVAVVMADDLADASPAEADAAVFGAAIYLDWRTADPRAARGRRPQLGPTLVTRDETGPLEGLRWHVARTPGAPSAVEALGLACPIAEALARASQEVELHAGDVVAFVGTAPLPVARGERVVAAVERLGALETRLA